MASHNTKRRNLLNFLKENYPKKYIAVEQREFFNNDALCRAVEKIHYGTKVPGKNKALGTYEGFCRECGLLTTLDVGACAPCNESIMKMRAHPSAEALEYIDANN